MAMASAGLRQAIDRRTRATYVLRSSSTAASENLRSLSVPAAFRLQGSICSSSSISVDLTTSDKHGGHLSPVTTAPSRDRCCSSTTAERMTRSASPSKRTATATAMGEKHGEDDGSDPQSEGIPKHAVKSNGPNADERRDSSLRAGVRSTSMVKPGGASRAHRTKLKQPRGPTRLRSRQPSKAEYEERTESSGDRDEVVVKAEEGLGPTEVSLDGQGAQRSSIEDRSGSSGHRSALFVPEKLVELMDDRDKAVQLCLQYRAKLKSAETKLKSTERRTSGLKRQLDEATSSGEQSRKMFAHMMEGVRAELGQKLRLAEARARNRDRSTDAVNEESRKVRIQLVRSRKDLRDLWLERDELAKLAGDAIQGENTLRKRTKRLESLLADLREKLSVATTSEEQIKQDLGHAEARANSAESAERELRAAVLGLKTDFEDLVDEIRQRDKKIHALEGAKAHLVDKLVNARRSSISTDTNMDAFNSDSADESRRKEWSARQAVGIQVERQRKGSVVNDISSDCSREEVLIYSVSDENGITVDHNRRSKNFRSGDRRPHEVAGAACRNDVPRGREGTTRADARRGLAEGAAVEEEPVTRQEQSNHSFTSSSFRKESNASTVRLNQGCREVSDSLPSRKTLAPESGGETGTRRSSMSYPLHGNRVTIQPAAANGQSNGIKTQGHDDSGGSGELYKDGTDEMSANRPLARQLTSYALDEEARTAHDFVALESDNGADPMGSTPAVHALEDSRYLSSTVAIAKGAQTSRVCAQPPLPRRPSHNQHVEREEFSCSQTPRRASDLGGLDPPSKTTCFEVSSVSLDHPPVRAISNGRGTAQENEVCRRVYGGDDVTTTLRSGVEQGAVGSYDGVKWSGDQDLNRSVTVSGGERKFSDYASVLDNGIRAEAVTTSTVTSERNQRAIFGSAEHDLLRVSRGTSENTSRVLENSLLAGVPLVKHGGAWSRAKAKLLWVSQDLSEIFYTKPGRTSNDKPTARMPLAEVRATKGTGSYLELQRVSNDEHGADRGQTRTNSFNLTNDRTTFGNIINDEQSTADRILEVETPMLESGLNAAAASQDRSKKNTANRIATSPDDGREGESGGKKWGVGKKSSTLPRDWTHGGRRWSWKKTKGDERWRGQTGFGTDLSLSTRNSPGDAVRGIDGSWGGVLGGKQGQGRRESLMFEAPSEQERDVLVEEINRLAHRVGGMQPSCDEGDDDDA